MKLRVSFLLVCSGAFAGCASLNCALYAPGGEPAIELAYVAGGDAPAVTLLRLYGGMARTPHHALLEFEPMGLRRSCRHIHGSQVLQLKSDLKRPELSRLLKDEADRGNEVGFHDPLLVIRTSELRFHRQPETFTPSVLVALSPVEALFVEAFPRLSHRFLPFRISELSDRAATPNPSLQRTTPGRSPGCGR